MIYVENVLRYNQLIRDNRRAVRKLEEELKFPDSIFKVNISIPTRDDYSNLLELTGDKNTLYILERISAFDKRWIATGGMVIGYDQISERMHLIKDIASCFKEAELTLDAMDFFENLKQKKATDIDLKTLNSMMPSQIGRGRVLIPYARISPGSLKTLDISLLSNSIYIK